MKTFIIDRDSISSEAIQELVGFVLRHGLAFRKIDLVSGSKIGASLVIELAKSEEKPLVEFLQAQSIPSPIIVKNDLKATLDGKKLGFFCQVRDVSGLSHYYLDKTSGKKFALVQGNA